MGKCFIVLLRAINVGGRKLIMADLRKAATARGLEGFRTYIQSGNLLLRSELDEAGVEAMIEALIAEECGLRAIALARAADRFAQIAAANPFPDGAPNQVHLCLSKAPPKDDAATVIAGRAKHGERVTIAEGALWIDFVAGAGESKLTPAVLDKSAGSTVTARNWNTVHTLLAMAAE